MTYRLWDFPIVEEKGKIESNYNWLTADKVGEPPTMIRGPLESNEEVAYYVDRMRSWLRDEISRDDVG